MSHVAYFGGLLQALRSLAVKERFKTDAGMPQFAKPVPALHVAILRAFQAATARCAKPADTQQAIARKPSAALDAARRNHYHHTNRNACKEFQKDAL